MSLQEHLRTTPIPPFYSVGVTKSHAASYLQQYRQHQWLAASRGLLSDSVPKAIDAPERSEYAAGRLDENSELLLARLRKTQISLSASFSQIDSDISRLEHSLLSKRRQVWARTGILALCGFVFLTILTSAGRRHLGFISRSLQPWIPLLPSPIAVYLIASRERQISAVEAAKERLHGLRAVVAASHPVSANDVDWLGSEKWDGVDWKRVGL